MSQNNQISNHNNLLRTPADFRSENYQETFTLDNVPQPINLQFNTQASTPMGEELLSTLRMFDTKTWSAVNKGVVTGFPMLDKAFQNGLPSGYYMICGDSNLGKTVMTTNITWRMLENNNDIFILDFSLDDPEVDKLSRLIASWVQIKSSYVKFPNEQNDEAVLRRRLGMTKLANCVDRYLCRDATFGNSIEKVEEEIKRVKVELETLKPGTQLVVLIDSFHDLMIDEFPTLTETVKFNKIAQWCADLAIALDLVLICTGELRKGEKDNARPLLNSIRESIKIRYEAKAIILLYNDVHYNDGDAQIYFEDQHKKKRPVLEAHIVKNKISDYKGRLFYYMWPDIGYVQECDKNQMQIYRNIISTK